MKVLSSSGCKNFLFLYLGHIWHPKNQGCGSGSAWIRIHFPDIFSVPEYPLDGSAANVCPPVCEPGLGPARHRLLRQLIRRELGPGILSAKGEGEGKI